jgi:hypothetical protein
MSTFRSEQLRQPLSLSGSFTGSFSGSLAGTASYATTASYAMNGGGTNINTSSFVLNSQTSSMTVATASYVTASAVNGTVASASYALTASFAMNGGGSVNTGGLLTTASFNSYTSSTTSQFAGTSSFATTASFALNAGGAGFPFTGNAIITGSLVVSGSSSGRSGITGSLQGTASFATTASYALNTNPGYTQLLYVFSQISSNDPSVPSSPATPVFNRHIINTTGRTFTFTRISAGIYHLIASDTSSFLENRTAIYLTPGQAIGSDFVCSYEWSNEGKIIIYSTTKNGTLSDSLFANTTLDIRIY